ncbi:MAG: T9SS type A sorting domain-containing protein [Bacteroidota bacterium]
MKHKKSIILFALFLFWGLAGAHGQNNTLASGGEATGSGGTLSYSVGQVDYIQAEGSGGTASQGVQQPFEIFVLGVDEHPEIQLDITVFPNPTVSNVTLHIGNFTGNDLSYQLYDIHGRLLSGQSLRTNSTRIPMEDLASAVYLLQVIDTSSPIKTFKIIKN